MRIRLTEPKIGPREVAAAGDVLDGGYLSPGPEVRAFEKEWAEYVGLAEAIAVNGGTAALILALYELRQKERRTHQAIAAPSYTCAPTVAAALLAGWDVVFIPAEPVTFGMDPGALEHVLHTGLPVRAILPVHLYGAPCSPDVFKVAAMHGLPVIEDACESHGATWDVGEQVGTRGLAGCWSFRGDKMMTTGGTGGIVATNDRFLATSVRANRDQWLARGLDRYEQVMAPGFGFEMSNLGAAIGRAQLRGLDEAIAHRRRLARLYREALDGIPGVELPPEVPGHVYWRFMIQVDDPVRLGTLLGAQGIEAVRAFAPLHGQGIASARSNSCVAAGDFSVDKQLHARGLCIPIGPHMDREEVNEVVGAIRSSVAGLAVR